MEEIQQNYAAGATDPDATIVQPRFDISEEQTAQPVVPLAGGAATTWRGGRRLPLALVLISALVGGLVSVFAYRLFQHAAHPSQVSLPAATRASQLSPELTAAAANASRDAAPAKVANTTETNTATEETKNETEKVEATKYESAKNEITKSETASVPSVGPTASRATDTTDKGGERVKRSAPQAATPRADRRDDEGASRAAQRPRAVEVERARRVDVITSPDAEERGGRVRRGEIDGDGQWRPEGREDRRARRARGRNIDRIRDIFGAPPPA